MALPLTVLVLLTVLAIAAAAIFGGGCECQQELADLRGRVTHLETQLSYWQNLTLPLLKEHTYHDGGAAPVCSVNDDSILTNITTNTHQIIRQLQVLRQQMEQLKKDPPQQLRTGTFQNPAPSCAYIHRVQPNSSSGDYWIQTAPGYAVLVYCDMERVCGCGNTTGWMRVAHLDMTREGEDCPSGLRLATYSGKSSRLCGRTGIGCTRTTFSVHGLEYRRVCGKVIGYQFSQVDAFWAYQRNNRLTLDQAFVDGVVLTHGSPRNHIWSFTASSYQGRNDAHGCPCSSSTRFTGTVPPFIGEYYFCDSGNPHSNNGLILYDTDPLWDGEGCRDSDHCCTFHNPPWFCKDLPQPTSDDIELRICGDEALSREDTSIELVDIYIQ